MISLIICATPRSGSYLLSDLLSQAGLPFAEEWLTEFCQAARKRVYEVPQDLGYIDYLQLLTRRERRAGLFAMKVMFDQFFQLSQRLMASPEVPGADFLQKFTHLFPNPHFIRVSRQNKLAQAVSLLKARQTGQWIKRRDEDAGSAVQPVYSFLGILECLRDRSRAEELWDVFFDQYGLIPFNLTYEELVANKRETVRKIVEWADLAAPVDSIDDTSNFRPMASGVNSQWADQFERDLSEATDLAPESRNSELEQLEIQAPELQESYEPGKRYRLELNILSRGEERIAPAGRPDGTGWLRISGLVTGATVRETFEQELQSRSPTTFSAPFVLEVPREAARVAVKVVLSSQPLSGDQIAASDGLEFHLNCQHAPGRALARQFLSGIRDLHDSWQYLAWFGHFFDDKFPWIYHSDHEWLFFSTDAQPNGVYHVLDAHLGWLEIDPASYPEVRVLKDGNRFVFRKRINDKRIFENLGNGQLLELETNRPEHLKQLSSET